MFSFLLLALKRSYADNETLNRRNSQTFFFFFADDFTLKKDSREHFYAQSESHAASDFIKLQDELACCLVWLVFNDDDNASDKEMNNTLRNDDNYVGRYVVLLTVLRCQLTYQGQAETNAEAWFNNSLRPWKPEGSLGPTAKEGHLDSHTAPELCDDNYEWNLATYLSVVAGVCCGTQALINFGNNRQISIQPDFSHNVSPFLIG